MNDAVCGSSSPAPTGEQSAHTEERGAPPKRRYSLNLAMQGDGPQAMADALYDIATDLLHGSFPGQRISGGYVEELEAYLSGSSGGEG